MAYPLLPLIFSTLFLPLLALAQSNGSVAVGKFLTANDTATPWLSPSRDFAFGFQKIRDKDTFLLCIWYDKIPDRAIVWYANEGTAVPRDSRVEITAERGLVLSDPQGKELWNSESIVDVVANGFMNDTGNFVLVGGNSDKLWESFKNPTDTILPAQLMERGGVLYSRQAEANFSRGRFQLRLQNDGNLVLYPVDVPSDMAYDAYYASGTYNASNSSNPGYQVIFNETGHLYINLRRNGETFELTPQVIPSASENYYRATLNFDGVFAQYHYPKVFTGVQNWTQVWSKPDNICLNIRGDEGSGACGYNSVCTLGESRRPICECPRRFSLLDPSDKYGSCKPEFTQSCDADEPTSAEDLYDFEVLTDTDWPTSDYAQLRPYSEEDCRKSCLQDCFCAVAIYRGDSCWKKKLPLSNGRKDSSVNGKAFLKFRKGDLSPQPPPKSQESKKDQGSLILVGSVLLGSSVFVNFVVIAAACLGFFLIYNKKVIRPSPSNNIVGDNLRCFTYKELVEATNGFKEELGRGAFGTVYKGTMQLVSRNIVAVKKLGNVVQDGDKEFNTEVNVIAQTHHKNLVRLLGFCNEADERLLVYEYMSNGSLAGFLFGDTKPSWDQRTHIALGIARGLSYLHEECSTQIIHCDIKPQNILLDDSYSARISDFGMAKLLMINQSRTNTAIRGTKGYVAPEWFRNTPVTVKVDVYSFGVLLLEITCCRRCVGDLEMAEEKAILTDWVWDCFREGRLDALVENDERALNDWEKFKRFVMVGIWCVQEDPSLRPAMKKIIQMLEGVVEVAVPPCPFPNFNSTSR
ncbi:hypothetical protein RJ640_028926 [Escallonia rubra]|uniref:Receptor-like serine/threonine-protein kinase n=1 Tax=Escallonia rubra TaxID=112253 RepID=A0AA88RE06_9ASTE|nr:hypothetical protein RJ640_028926 [Escallonia rubra]